jgi:hypothetical protein
MAITLVYITEEGKEFVRNNSERYASNTIARMLNVPASEVMNVIITEKLPGNKKHSERKSKREIV